MKKVFNILIIFMIIVFGTISVKAEVYEGHIVRGAKLSTPYYHRHDKPDTYFVEQNGFIYRTTDGSYVYCVQPFVSLNGTATYEMTIDDIWSVINMTQEQWEHIARVAYYGYGYVHGNYDHSDERWQAATQMIIWNLSDPNIISYFTRGMNGPRDDTILADEMAEIEYLVNRHTVKPHFDNVPTEMRIGQTITLTDTEGVLDNFEVLDVVNANITKNGNDLTITATNTGTISFNLRNNADKYGEPTTLYYSTNAQNVMRRGKIDPVNESLSINVVAGKLKITKVDSDTNTTTAQGQADLRGAIYNVFNSNGELVSTLTIGNDNSATTDYLPFGTYTVRETQASRGYMLDNTTYTIDLSSNDITELIVKETVIKGNVRITKHDSETHACVSQGDATLAGATYGIYDPNNNLVDTVSIGNDCTATSRTLPYSAYKVRELNPSNGYYIDTNEYQANVYDNNVIANVISEEQVIKGKIHINKIDSDTNSCNSQGKGTLVGAIFEIKDRNNNVVERITTNDNCIAESRDLPFANYTIREYRSSTGYLLNTNDYTVNLNSNSTFALTIPETVIKGRIKVIKHDSETHTCRALGEATLVGAKYGIYDLNDNLLETLTIGDDCSATSNLLPFNDYKVKEISPSTGYYIDNSEYRTSITDNNITINITSEENVIKGKIKVNKVDSENNQCLPQGEATLKDAVFEIRDIHNNLVDTITTNNECNATSIYLPYGNYKVRETRNSKGYYINTNTYNQFISADNSYDITIPERVIKNDFNFYKFYGNESTGFMNLEANATFEVFNNKNNKVNTFTTNNDGYAKITLPYGTYKVKQTIGLDEYKMMYPFNIRVNEYSPLEQTNFIRNGEITAKLKLIKVDSETGNILPLSGFKFRLINADNGEYMCQTTNEVICEFETNEDGIFITPLPLNGGNYAVEEIKAVPNYLLSSERVEFSITNSNQIVEDEVYGSLIEVNFPNQVVKGEVNITKRGEKFVAKNGTFDYEEIPLTGVSYKLYANNDIKLQDGTLKFSKNGTVATFTTDNETYTIHNLYLGDYCLVETATERNHILDETPICFTLEYKDEETPIVKIDITQKNYLKKGKVILTKTDLIDGEVIPNTKLEIYTENDELIYSGITDEFGNIELDKLSPQKYYIIETEAATGYKITTEKVLFEITEDGEIIKATMTNERITGTLEFTKVDLSDSTPLPNTLVEIYTENDELIYSGRTNADGKVIIPELRYGKYYILEKEAPEGYVLNEEKMYFEIKEDGEIVKSIIEDKRIIGSLEFTKIDFSDSAPLPNTLIEIYTEFDELVFKGRTDNKGKIKIPELRYGKYYILEKEAPEGYVLNNEKMYFEIKEDGEVIKSIMKDERIMGTLEFTKMDFSDSTPLPDTLIEIYNEDDELIFSGRTNENGKIIIPELRYGRYYILEKEAPEGYTLNEERMYFEIRENGEVVKATMTDDKIVIEVPATDANSKHIIEIIGGVFIIIGIGVKTFGKRKNKANKQESKI